MNGFSNLETYMEYSVAPTDNRIRVCLSKVKVMVGRQGGEGICVDAEASMEPQRPASKSIF